MNLHCSQTVWKWVTWWAEEVWGFFKLNWSKPWVLWGVSADKWSIKTEQGFDSWDRKQVWPQSHHPDRHSERLIHVSFSLSLSLPQGTTWAAGRRACASASSPPTCPTSRAGWHLCATARTVRRFWLATPLITSTYLTPKTTRPESWRGRRRSAGRRWERHHHHHGSCNIIRHTVSWRKLCVITVKCYTCVGESQRVRWSPDLFL